MAPEDHVVGRVAGPMKGRALLIDDEAPVGRITRLYLQGLGYAVEEHRSAEDALEAVHADAEAYDFVLTDHLMPNMTGLEVAARIRDIRADLPIVLCTGFTGILTQDEVTRAGVQEVLLKPYTREALSDVLDRLNLTDRPRAATPARRRDSAAD